MEIQKTANQMCNVCLSPDRVLAPPGKYLDLFSKIFRKGKSTCNPENLLICWECHAVLRKIEQFRQKAEKAQSFLKNVGSSLEEYAQYNLNFQMSTLQVVLNNNTNYYFNENDCTQLVEIIDSNDIKKEDDELKYTDNLLNQCEDKKDTHNKIKEEKLDINEEILNNLFNINDDGEAEFKGEIDDDVYDEDVIYETIKKKKAKKKSHRKLRKQYKIVYKINNEILEPSKYHSHIPNIMYDKVPVEMNELMLLRENFKTMKQYTKFKYKCDACVTGYANKKVYLLHMKKHDKAMQYECDICHQTFLLKKNLCLHFKVHMFKYQCQVCRADFMTKRVLVDHTKNDHDKAFECLDCGAHFRNRSEVLAHHKRHLEFICDYCGKICRNKHTLEKHIITAHLPHICKICNIKFKQHRSYRKHTIDKHVTTRTEEAFCVECNIQFNNVSMYKRHLNTSVKHKPKSDIKYPCPECNKLFNKKMNMKYHYNYFHTDRTKFYCQPCAKYFLNNYQLRRHKAVFHDNIKPPKNKFCPHCGRGFSERRTLNNHIRTHTGERPYACSLCDAAFTQAYPLTTHMRAVHKMQRNNKVHLISSRTNRP